MLKDQLREQNNVLKNISEEILMLIRRKIFNHNLSLLTLMLNKVVGQFNKILGKTEEARGAPSRHQIQKIHILVLITTTSMQENQ